MKRILLLLCLLCLTAPAWAQTATAIVSADPWRAGTEEFIVQGSYARDQLTGHWTGNATFAWGHFVTDKTEIGTVTRYTATGQEVGTGFGAFYEWSALRTGAGDLILGGDAERLTGDLTEAATYRASSRVGWKRHVGKSAAFRASLDFSRALQRQDPAGANLLNDVGIVLGASFALPQ